MDPDKNSETSTDIIENSESKKNAESHPLSIDINNDIEAEPHNGKQISLVSVSPNGTYIATYSKKDDSIEGWIEGWMVDEESDDGVSKWIPLKQDPKVATYKVDNHYEFDKVGFRYEIKGINEIKVNDNKIVLYGDKYSLTGIIQMSDNDHPIELNLDSPLDEYDSPYYFKKNGDLVINKRKTRALSQIHVYSLQNNKPISISSYQLSCGWHNAIGRITDDNILWTISSNHLFQWKIDPLQLEFSYLLGFDRIDDVKIRKDLIMVKYKKGIEICSKRDHSLIQYIQADYPITEIELFCDRYLLVIMKVEEEAKEEEEKQQIRLYDLIDNHKWPVDATKIFKDDESENNIFLYEYNTESKKAFRLVNGRISSMNLSNWNCHGFFKSNYVYDVGKTIGWNAYLNEESNETLSDHGNDEDDMDENLSNHVDGLNETLADMENFIKIFPTKHIYNSEIEIININFKNERYKWRINPDQNKLLVYDNTNDELLDSKHLSNHRLYMYNILNNDALAYNSYMTIHKYDINNRSIKILYYYSTKGGIRLTADEKSGSKLPINIDQGDKNFEIINEWIINFTEVIIKNNKYLAKYGQTLLPILIQRKLTSHIESIYSNCLRLAKEDPKRNLKFLNIITLSMKDLYEKYPDYITRFNSEIFMLLDPFHEKITDHYEEYFHFFAFSQEMDVKLSKLFLFYLQKYLKYLLLILLFPATIIISLIIIYYNYRHHSTTSQYIFLIVPYVSISCYPSKYSWWKDFFLPQSSVFVDTYKTKEFYTNWNGEAIINFKWNKFGRYYYFGGWLTFTVFLICFTMASYPSNSITQEIRIRLYQISIVFGFLHLVFELRQFIWNPIKYVESIWNWFGAYLFATITSLYEIYYENTSNWVLSVSCLLLDVKFLLFFRIFELFGIGIYFAIIFGVAKRICSFLVILAIIIISFAHAFFVLLHPDNYIDSLSTPNSNSSDLNNPWSLTNTYSKVDENGNIDPNETIIQTPDQNTNLFYSYPTSLLAKYRFLTGDQGSLSSRTPTAENSILLILTALFSFIVVIYLMNLFIGLLNIAIEKEVRKTSYLILKAEILADIELFYLLPFQRRWRTWFPEVIYYTVSVETARIHAKKAIEDGKWKTDHYDYKILKFLDIKDAINDYMV